MYVDQMNPLVGSELRNAEREAFVAALITVCQKEGSWKWVSLNRIMPVLGKMAGFWVSGGEPGEEGRVQLHQMIDEGLIAQKFVGRKKNDGNVRWRVTKKLLKLLITSQYSGGVVYENKKELLSKLKATKELND